ncbi:MAG: aspartate--tRNA ligase [Bacilli bacterium]|nr:aspartate--tRNA ligase [Bacilli bacterium]
MKIMCDSINKNNIGEKVTLYGWVNKKRDLGGLIFIDLRDRSGIIQLVVDPDSSEYEIASTLKNEFVIKVEGLVRKRQSVNDKLKTGEIEILVDKLDILNKSDDLPFDLNNVTALEDTRLKYRYLDLRRSELQNNLMIKHKIMKASREYLDSLEFVELETPILCKSTPEGARDYLVPSRVNKNSFYALPQSPQIFKQLLMMSGFERYYQIARCFRDEDLRADRQPEFTQIDMEMSFVNQDDVIGVTEGLLAKVFKDVKGIDIKLPIERMTYDNAIDLYGSDKPDLRFEMKIHDISSIFKNSDFKLFTDIINNNGIVNCIVVRGEADNFSRKAIDKLTDFVKIYGAKALAFLKYNGDFSGSVAKFVDDSIGNKLVKDLKLSDNDLIFIIAGDKKMVKTSLGALRCKLAKDLNIISDEYKLLWITDFPMFEYSEEEDRYIACHHPFTMPANVDDLDDKENAKAIAYDIVLNGYELGGGSIRIHDMEVQDKVLKSLGLTKEEANDKFGFLLKALTLGAPPHGGLAIGLERFTMILSGTENIRDVIAFPKTTSASDLMTDAPGEVDIKQLDELNIKLKD